MLRASVEMRDTCLCVRGKGGADVCYCPVEGVVEVVSRRYALPIIGLIGNHSKIRFKNIVDHFNNLSPNTLTVRLKELERHGLVERRSFAEIPPRVEYSLSRRGRELREAIKPLMAWASGH